MGNCTVQCANMKYVNEKARAKSNAMMNEVSNICCCCGGNGLFFINMIVGCK